MRRLLVLAAGTAMLGSGCANPPPAAPPAANTAHSAPAGGSPAFLQPAEQVQGQVVSANPSMRFVVMDFPLRSFPAIGQVLYVYRQGQRIGEVKVTGPARDTVIAGDILIGEARTGDQVRQD